MLSVVVPVLNEEAELPAFLEMARPWAGTCELVFSDGGSTDATPGILSKAGARVVEGPRGRGAQCNRGAAACSGDAVLFLHADCRVGADAVEAVARAAAGGVEWGCLTLRWDAHGLVWRFGERASNLRVRVTGVPFGDQGVFVSRALLGRVGGVPDLPLMEDYELARRLRATGAWPRQLPYEVRSSPRRFVDGGPLRVALQMRRLRCLYRRGVAPDELARMYRDVR